MCIFMERHYCCPQEKNTPLTKPGKPSRPDSPWLDWKHGELISNSEVALKPFPNHHFVRHRISSRIRCINWEVKSCDDAPRETHHLMYKSSCPDCTAADRCFTTETPYKTYRISHGKTIKTVEDHARFNAALASYWQYLMRIQTSIMRYTIYNFYSQELLFDNIDVDLQDVYHFFASMVCTSHADHVDIEETMIPHHCEACECTTRAPGHNLLRSLLLRESRTAWNNGAESFSKMLETLQEKGLVAYLQKTREEQIQVRQDWFKDDFITKNRDLKHYIKAIDRICKEIIQIGPCLEDENERDHGFHHSWADVLGIRRTFAVRMLLLINLDDGITNDFFEELVYQHILTMLLPWPSKKTAQGPNRLLSFYPNSPIHETLNFVTSLDNYDQTLYDIYKEHTQAESNLIDVLKKQRAAMRDNAILRHNATISYLDGLPTLSASKATAKDACCSICGDDWQDGKLPKPMRILAMPCVCSKPYHFSCLRRLLTSTRNEEEDKNKMRCPLCRTDFIESQGWFGEDYKQMLTPVPAFVRGFIPVIDYDSDDESDSGYADLADAVNPE